MQKRPLAFRKTSSYPEETIRHLDDTMRNFLARELKEDYMKHTIAQWLRRFWAVEFPPALEKAYREVSTTSKEYQDVLGKDIMVSDIQLTPKRGENHLTPRDVITAEGATHEWRVTTHEWTVKFDAQTSSTKLHISMVFFLKVDVLLRYHDTHNIDIVKINPNTIWVREITLTLPNKNRITTLHAILVAEYDASTTHLVPNKHGIQHIIKTIGIALHCESKGISHWVREVTERIVEALRKNLRGAKVRLYPYPPEEITIKDITISPLTGHSNLSFAENAPWAEMPETRKHIVKAQYPVDVLTEDGKKINGYLTVSISLIEPIEQTIPPIVRLSGVYIYIKKDQRERWIHVEDIKIKVDAEGRRLPPPEAFLTDDSLQVIVNKIIEDIEKD